ncbi:MAG: tetratricopeptide repeat protein, partial [Mesorhizobium sp.]
CGPCKQLTPQLEKAVKAAGGKVKLVKMNIDDHPSIAGQLGIQSIPAVIAFKDGQPVDGFMGAIPESQINQFIQKVGGKGGGAPQIADALAAAAEARTAGDVQTAADIYDAILEARFDLAMIQNARGDRNAAADNLLAIVKADRSWNDDGARAQLLKLFEAWGMTDEATLAARRKLSSLLFS